jgi:hypothetical protein
MKHRIATIAAAALLLAGGATVASTASARDAFNISIGLPGFAVGYANRGYYAPPPVVYAPEVAYYDAPEVAYYDAPVVYAAPVVYGPRIVYGRPYYRPYYRPYFHAHYWHR